MVAARKSCYIPARIETKISEVAMSRGLCHSNSRRRRKTQRRMQFSGDSRRSGRCPNQALDLSDSQSVCLRVSRPPGFSQPVESVGEA